MRREHEDVCLSAADAQGFVSAMEIRLAQTRGHRNCGGMPHHLGPSDSKLIAQACWRVGGEAEEPRQPAHGCWAMNPSGDPDELRERAARYRAHARWMIDPVVRCRIDGLADELEARAAAIELGEADDSDS